MLIKAPLVSVIICTYNRDAYIARAVESALSQTYENVEVIVIDDGSVDNTKRVMNSYAKNKKVTYVFQENQGVSIARNNAIQLARGEYIAILDSDDFWCYKEKLSEQVDFLMKNPEYVLVGGGLIKLDIHGKEIVRYLPPENDADIKRTILVDNPFAHSTVMFKKGPCQAVGGYDETLRFSEDRDLWLKLGRVGKLHNLPKYMAYYLEGGQNQFSLTIRRSVFLNIAMRKKYKNDYPHFKKAVLLCWLSYLSSFLPFRKKLWPVLFKLRVVIFGEPSYTYFENYGNSK